MLSLDEAIKHCEEVAYQKDLESGFETDNERYAMTDKERIDCKKCAEEHRQLAEWLKKLQAYEKAREEIIRRKYSDQWSKTVVIHIIDKHLKEVNADE